MKQWNYLLKVVKVRKAKIENDENVSNIEINEVVLVHCNIVNNDYQQDSKVFHMFVPNKSFGQVLEFSLLKYDLLIKVLNC